MPAGNGIIPEIARAARAGRPVIFVGLDGADWQLLDGHVARGVMPNLAALVAEGSGGVLLTEPPPLSPLLWTTMMTGVGPLAHGILDFTRFHPQTGAREPITSDERRVPAIWNMATMAGRRVAVLGLWATYPAEAVEGLVVSERLFSFQNVGAPPAGSGVVYPAAEEARARAALARVESETGALALRAHLPWLEAAEFERLRAEPDPYAHPVGGLRRILVETRLYHELALAALRRAPPERPDLVIVYFQGTDAVGHLFAPFAPPRQEGVAEEDFARYAGVAESYFRTIDSLLGEYRELARARGAVLVLASDHGFLWGEGRPRRAQSAAAATAGRWHREEGIYLLWGPGVRPEPGHRGRGGVRQVCATLLALLGLPPGKGLAGPPLPGTPPGEGGGAEVDYAAFHRPAAPAASAAPGGDSGEELAKLRALGYLGGGEAARRPAAEAGSTRTPGSHNNEGLILERLGRGGEAEAAFARALALDPGLGAAAWNLARRLAADGRDPERVGDLLVAAVASGVPEAPAAAAARALDDLRRGEPEKARRLLDHALAADAEEPELRLARGRLRMATGECAGAAEDFTAATAGAPASALAHASLGLARLCLGDEPGAARSLERSLALDSDQPEIRRALAGLTEDRPP